MEKYKYSSLTDEQHERIVETINSIYDEKTDCEAAVRAARIQCYIDDLELVGFIGENEKYHYSNFVGDVFMKRKVAQHGNLSER